MSEIGKKRVKFEILEDMENYLNRMIESIQTDIDYDMNPENYSDGVVPDWRLDEVKQRKIKLEVMEDVRKGLLKLA